MKAKSRENWIFVTFADGSPDFVGAGERIHEQASLLEIFNDVRVYDGTSLAKINQTFRNNYFKNAHHTRGFAYWIWKPMLFKSIQEEFLVGTQELTGVFYADAGCEIPNNIQSRRYFKKLLQLTGTQSVLAESTFFPEGKYTKRAVFEMLDPSANHSSSSQLAATWVAIRFDKEGLDFVDDWYRYCLFEDGRLLNDVLGAESSEFVDHRHDQSIFSLLFKSRNYQPYQRTMFKRFGSVRNSMQPIWTSRNRTPISELRVIVNNDFFATFGIVINFAMKKISRFRLQ